MVGCEFKPHLSHVDFFLPLDLMLSFNSTQGASIRSLQFHRFRNRFLSEYGSGTQRQRIVFGEPPPHVKIVRNREYPSRLKAFHCTVRKFSVTFHFNSIHCWLAQTLARAVCVCVSHKSTFIFYFLFSFLPPHTALCAALHCRVHTHTLEEKKIKNLFSQSLFPRATERFWTTASANTSEPADCISMTDSARSFARSPAAIGSIFERESISRTLSLSRLQLRPFARVSLCSLFVLCCSALCNYGARWCLWRLVVVSGVIVWAFSLSLTFFCFRDFLFEVGISSWLVASVLCCDDNYKYFVMGNPSMFWLLLLCLVLESGERDKVEKKGNKLDDYTQCTTFVGATQQILRDCGCVCVWFFWLNADAGASNALVWRGDSSGGGDEGLRGAGGIKYWIPWDGICGTFLVIDSRIMENVY